MRDLARRWLDAWRAGNVADVLALTESFSDPDTGGALSGARLEAHLEAVFDRFPQWQMEADPAAAAATEHTIVLDWTVTAAQRGTYLGMPAAGGHASVSGVDVLRRVGERVAVTRHFDRLALAESLGHAARFLPRTADGFQYGISMGAGTGRAIAPGALTLTWLDVADEAEGADVNQLTYEVVKSLRHSKGFLGAAIFEIGDRRYTLSVFDSLSAVRAVHARPHQRAMRRFFRGGLCTGAYTSVWSLERDSLYLRCPVCHEVVSADQTCSCAGGGDSERDRNAQPQAGPLFPRPEE
ncbi:SnoaL-like polyketide cyclase [Prauserella sp. Am3]|nr:SnoaL-like polyketide cyclase [Prauserella sp. Am3]